MSDGDASLVWMNMLEATRRPEFSWSPLRPGVDQHVLYGGGADQASAAILRYAPGARVPYHRHVGHEHIYVLAGSQRDERGTYRAGAFIVNPPGSSHDVTSDDGCTVLIVWERPVAFIER
jgi:anti-sigma factor ChrR (cupin superfamily)